MSAENATTNQFENVNGSAGDASGSAENAVQGENELAQQLNQNVPPTNGNVATAPPAAENNTAAAENNAAAAAENNTAAGQNNTAAPAQNNTAAGQNNTAVPPQNNTAAPVPVTTSGYVMSAKAKDLQERRKALFKEMQGEYAKIFGDDKKAPKAKMYHAAGLLTIRERDGEDAYQAKLQEYIQANQGKYTTKTRKVNNTAAAPESVTGSPTVASPVSAAESGKAIIRSIESMASKVKEMVDTMVSTTKTLLKSDKPDMAAIAERVVRFANETGTTAKKPRKPRSNKGKTHRHKSSANA